MAASTPVSRHPVRDLSPHFRRVTLTGPSLRRFGVLGPTRDLRIKMLLPNAGHKPQLPGTSGGVLHPGWYQDWLRQEQPGRGFIRSYTVRNLRRTADGPEIDVDFVLHPDSGGQPGPGSSWAMNAVHGTPAWFVGPDATAIKPHTPLADAGINWRPGSCHDVLLAGDETAVPAISSILESLPEHITGHAFLEVPGAADILPLATRSGIRVLWLYPHGAESRGVRLRQAVRSLMDHDGGRRPEYAWVGAEAATVRDLRSHLVALGLDPKTSEFRGYWSLGKAGSGANGTPISSQVALPG